MKFRAKRKETQAQIDKAEEALIEILPTQAQLHLTLLGILDNGVPRKITKSQTSKKIGRNTGADKIKSGGYQT